MGFPNALRYEEHAFITEHTLSVIVLIKYGSERNTACFKMNLMNIIKKRFRAYSSMLGGSLKLTKKGKDVYLTPP